MKQEQIEKAAREFTDNLIAENQFDVNYEEDNYDAGRLNATDEVGFYAFIKGAEWRINSVWHDASKEEPNLWKLILRKDRHGDYDLGYETKKDTVSWAYVKDLIPEKEVNNG